jgi:hypothetical protein
MEMFLFFFFFGIIGIVGLRLCWLPLCLFDFDAFVGIDDVVLLQFVVVVDCNIPIVVVVRGVVGSVGFAIHCSVVDFGIATHYNVDGFGTAIQYSVDDLGFAIHYSVVVGSLSIVLLLGISDVFLAFGDIGIDLFFPSGIGILVFPDRFVLPTVFGYRGIA